MSKLSKDPTIARRMVEDRAKAEAIAEERDNLLARAESAERESVEIVSELKAANAALRGGPRFTLTVLHTLESRSDGPGVHVETGWRFSDGRIAATATQNE